MRVVVGVLDGGVLGQSAFAQRLLESLPGATIARGCLLDHAAELRNAVEAVTEETVSIEIDDQALDRAARLWEIDAG